MLGRRHPAAASPLRARGTTERSAGPPAPSRRQSTALLVALLAVAVALTAASLLVKPSAARSFDLFSGSLLLNDNTSPVSVDLASGKPTVRLSNAFKAVSARSTGDLDVIPLAGATLMLNPSTGEFNMVDQSGFVVKTTGGGVALPKSPGASHAAAVPTGDSAYIVQSAPGRASVYLVSQSTVASAIGPSATAKARAFGTVGQSVVTSPGGLAAANGDLWLLTGGESTVDGASRSVTRLSVPRRSNAGVKLAASRRGDVTGVAALESTARNSDGTGADVLAVASARGIDLYGAAGTARRLSIRQVTGLQRILPVSNAVGEVDFLYQTRDGWSLVSARADGAGAAEVHRIAAISAAEDLVPPAQSGGQLYTTASNGSGRLWQISSRGTAQPVPGAAQYPLLPHEPLDREGIQVQARGSRVIVNARGNFEAVVVFSDGSQRPRVIDKHSAVQIDASSATSLSVASSDESSDTKAKAQPNKPAKAPPAKPKTTTTPRQPVNDKVSCKTTTQQPHIPTVQLVERGSRSVQLQWTYPLLDPQDCAASTYTVAVKLLNGSGAPPPPATVTVQGQDGVNLTGLFPDSEYQLVVTAYINGRGTPSPGLIVRTSVEGPPAPSEVKASVDSSGNWNLSWNSCGGVQTGCVSTASWQIIARFCDGLGLSSPPAARALAGDPTQHHFTFTFAGSAALLGRGLSFQVEGIGTRGTIGTPSGQSSCASSWTPPVPGNITVQASAPPLTTGGSTTRTTVSLHFAGGQTHDLGGVGGTVTYQLLSGGSVVSTVGPTSRDTASLSGIRAGQRYQVAVTAAAPGHPNATARIGPVNVTPAIARWPQPSVSAAFANDDAATGTLTVRVGFSGGSDSRGESFDLVNSSLVCGNSAQELSYTNFAPGASLRFDGISRVRYNSASGSCRVVIQLQQNADHETDPPLYGAGRSASSSASVSIAAPTFSGSRADFTAAWGSRDPHSPSVQVSYNSADPLLTTYATNWRLRVSNGDTANCGTVLARPPTSVPVAPNCAKQGGTFSVTVSFDYFGSTRTYTIAVQGDAPEPIDYSKMTFTAQWSRGSSVTRGGFVVVGYADGHTYDQSTLNGLNWTFTVTSSASPGVTCGSSSNAPRADGGGPSLQIDFAKCPAGDATATPPTPLATYTLIVHVDDSIYGPHDWTPAVSGTLLP